MAVKTWRLAASAGQPERGDEEGGLGTPVLNEAGNTGAVPGDRSYPTDSFQLGEHFAQLV